jgi:DNA-binding SARP family transcriptional activator
MAVTPRHRRQHLPRELLVERLLEAPEVVLIEAGGGFGKSVLVDQALSASNEALLVRLPRRFPVGPDDLEAMVLHAAAADLRRDRPRVAHPGEVGVDEPVGAAGLAGILLVDNAQALTDPAAAWLADLALDGLPSLRVVVSGRTLPAALAALEFRCDAVRFVSDSLRFTPDESTALVELELGGADARRLASNLHHFSGGWPALLMLAVRRLAHAADRVAAATELVRHPALIGQLVDYYASELDPADRELTVQLAHLPLLNESIVEALGSRGLLGRLSHAGIPLTMGHDGWWRFPSTIREHLASRARLDVQLAKRVAPLFVAQGEEVGAAGLLADSGDLAGAAHLLAGLSTERINRLDPLAFIRVLNRLGSAADVAPGVLLHLARVYGNVGQLTEEREVIERALRVVRKDPPTDDPIAIEVEAEWLFLQAQINDPATLERIEPLMELAPKGTRAQARLLEALGEALSELPDEASLRRAENALRHAAIVWGELGEPSRAASAQRGLAVRVLSALGRWGDAARLLRRVGDSSETPYDHLLCLVFEARMLALSGEREAVEAVLDQALPLADLLGISWVAGYAAWVRVTIAANDHDAARVLEQLALAEANLGQLAYEAAGLFFVCEAADACAAVGAGTRATRLLAVARSRKDEDPAVVGLTEAFIGARRGDPEAARALQDMLTDRTLRPGLRWKAELLRGHAEMLAGNTTAATQALQEGLDCAARVGHPDLPDRRERRIVEALRASIVAAREDEAGDREGQDERYELRLLGGFEVHRGGERLAAPRGRPTDLIKYVALARGATLVETVIEILWPDEEPGIGQRRLKNVLSRARASYGPLVVREGSQLRLVSCWVDLHEFEQRASTVATSGNPERVDRARRALAVMTGPLLPDDLYDDWIAQRRESVRRRALGLIDVVITAALTRGDLDEALAMLHTATTLDPYDPERPLRVARALAAEGRDLEVRNLAAEASAIATELGIPAAVEWEELVTRMPVAG